MEIDILEQSIQDISPDLLKILLADKTTKKFIRWGSDNYTELGLEYSADQEITPDLITGHHTSVIQPRVSKSDEDKAKRTKDRAEVFTPSWVCNEQNNLVDAAWFGRINVFNIANNKSWETISDEITFPRDKIWKDYVDARRMEISCGEAPYLVSRYDTVSGKPIPLKDRIGLLDRKLRIVNENALNNKEWMEWVIRAFQSCYGYDFQGDNVLLARENLLYTFIEYTQSRTGKDPSLSQMKKIANIISWNIWQMNGLSMTAPYSLASPVYTQMNLSDLFDMSTGDNDTTDTDNESELLTESHPEEIPCKIFDWRSNESIEFRSMIKGD